MQCALIAWLTSLFYFDGYRISGTESLVYGAFMKDICSTYSCGCLFSWPLAFVGKLLPVPKMPFEEYFGRCFNCCGKRGILMFSVLFAMLRAWLLPVFPSGARLVGFLHGWHKLCLADDQQQPQQQEAGSGALPQVNGSWIPQDTRWCHCSFYHQNYQSRYIHKEMCWIIL